jgi:hypothetical protein
VGNACSWGCEIGFEWYGLEVCIMVDLVAISHEAKFS